MPGLAERTEAISDLLDRLAEVERPEHDASGYPVRRGEVSALDLAPAALSRLESRGYRVIGRDPLPTLGHEIVRLAVPAGLSAREGAAAIAAADPSATIDLVHYYALEPAGGNRTGFTAKEGKTAPVRIDSGKPVIGMIDTAVTPSALPPRASSPGIRAIAPACPSGTAPPSPRSSPKEASRRSMPPISFAAASTVRSPLPMSWHKLSNGCSRATCRSST
jgi:hypothetical protein